MPMRVGDTPEGDAPAGAPAEASPPGEPLPEDPEAAKKKKADGGGLDDAVDAASWGCAILECFDCASILALSAVTTAVLVRRSRRKRRLAETR